MIGYQCESAYLNIENNCLMQYDMIWVQRKIGAQI